jgi:hypothetical protein
VKVVRERARRERPVPAAGDVPDLRRAPCAEGEVALRCANPHSPSCASGCDTPAARSTDGWAKLVDQLVTRGW